MTAISKTEYNAKGNPVKFTDPANRETIMIYAANQVDITQIQQKVGSGYQILSNTTYAGSTHLPQSVTDTSGNTTYFTYNSKGKVLQVTNRDNATTYRHYQRRNSSGVFVDDDQNGAFLKTLISPDPSNYTYYTYDSHDRVRTVTTYPDVHTLTFDYDNFDRVTQITYPDNTTQQYFHDRLDLAFSKDRKNRWTTYTHNANRQLTSVKNPNNETISYQYCQCGMLSKIIKPGNHVTSFTFDVANRISQITYPDGISTVDFAYTASGRLWAVQDAKDQATVYSYTVDGNKESETYYYPAIGTQPVSPQYFAYDSNFNRLVSRTDNLGTTTYAYRPINTSDGVFGDNELYSVDGPWANDTKLYYYDAMARLYGTSINGAADATVKHYDSLLGRLDWYQDNLDTFVLGYEPHSNRLSWKNSTYGPTTSYAYMPAYNDSYLQEVKNTKKNGVQTSRFGKYQDVVGNLTNWNRCFDGSSIIETQTPEHDLADRLTKLARSIPGGVNTTWNYSYDSSGNRTIENPVTGGASDQKNYTPNSLDEITQINAVNPSSPDTAMSYDANGNLIQSIVTIPGYGSFTATYQWDAKNQLVAAYIPGLQRSEFTYDGLGRRVRIVEKNGSGVVTSDRYYIWDGMRIAEERASPASTPIKIYSPFGEVRSGLKYYYTKDHLGSTREVLDASGNIVARYDYDPFGVPTQTLPVTQQPNTFHCDMLYTGHFYHAPTQLYLAPYRAYNPGLGRWITQDPIGFAGGINLYNYNGANPLSRIDPSGLLWGDQSGASARDWYAAQSINPCNGSLARSLYAAAGIFAAAWTPETSDATALTLMTGGSLGGLAAVGEAGVAAGEVAAVEEVAAGEVAAIEEIAARSGEAAESGVESVGRFIVDRKGNTLIEPPGGSTVGNAEGTFVETRFANGSPAQQLHGPHRNYPQPHGHGFEPGPGVNVRGASLDPSGNAVPANSPAAHWPVNQ